MVQKQREARKTVIVSAVNSNRLFGVKFVNVSAVDLGAGYRVLESNVKPECADVAIMCQAQAQFRVKRNCSNGACHGTLASYTSFTINKVCGSGLKAAVGCRYPV